MTRLIFALALLFAVPTQAKPSVCRLHGRVRFVSSFARYKVRIDDAFPDLRVRMVDSFASAPGEWQKVDSGEAFTVQIVDAGEDFKISFVDSFPGCD